MTPIRLTYTPRAWQRKCHGMRAGCRFLVLVLHRRAGKTELAIMELIDKALQFDRELGLFVYLAPLLKQAKAIAWARLKQKLLPLLSTGALTVNEGDLSVHVRHNGATIRLFGGDNPDALRGVRLDGVVIDEVAQIKPEVWNEVIQPALSDRLGWAMFIGTPSGVNLFSELYYRAQGGEAGWKAALWTVYDTDAINPDEVTRLREGGMPENSFAREYLCDFTASGDDQLISLADAENAAHRIYKPGEVDLAPRIVGVDPARFGDDRSVLVRRQGLQMFDPSIFQGIDNMALAARVAAVIEDWTPDAVFIDSGAGAGVIDRLRQLGHDVLEVPFGGKAVQPHLFLNRRSEMWWGMKEWLESGGAIPNDLVLKKELAAPIYWFDASGRKVLESKDDIKKRLKGGQSPDIADALALTFASPVSRKTPLQELQDRFGSPKKREHDPYAAFRGPQRR